MLYWPFSVRVQVYDYSISRIIRRSLACCNFSISEIVIWPFKSATLGVVGRLREGSEMLAWSYYSVIITISSPKHAV